MMTAPTVAILGLLTLLLAGCAAEPFDYHSDNEIPEGRGLLTGEDGEFVIYQKAD